jgi:hypothetical protein
MSDTAQLVQSIERVFWLKGSLTREASRSADSPVRDALQEARM